MKTRIVLGLFSILAVSGVLALVALREQDRMASFTEAFSARQIESGAALFENNCRSCHGPQGRGLEGVGPTLNAADLFDGRRLSAVAFSGSLEDYLRGVIAAGRPVPTAGTSYPLPMPTWSQRYGGPLRDDQVEALVLYIVNWRDQALAEGAPAPTAAPGETFGTDIAVALPAGDAAAGERLAETLGCAGCHVQSTVGPPWLPAAGVTGVGARAAERIVEPGYTGAATTPEQYLVESIVLPDVDLTEGYAAGLMPPGYGGRLTPQDVADLVAYLLTLR
jgi:mono/diheme cytochrome c family protein